MLGWDTPAERPSGLNRLEFLVFRNTTPNVEDDFTESDAHGDFHKARVVHLAGESEDGRSWTSLRADGTKPLSPVHDDLWDIGIALDVVQVCGFAPKP